MGERTTLDKQVKFAVRFAFADLDWYREGDWMNLREDLRGFLDSDRERGEYETRGEGVQLEDMPEAQLRKIQGEMKNLLDFFVGRSSGQRIDTGDGGQIIVNSVRSGLAVPVKLAYFVRPGSFRAVGSTRDCLLARLIGILVSTGSRTLARCPQCDKIFYRRGKQIFCSRTCTNREMAQRKRSRDAAAMKATKKKLRTRKGGITDGKTRRKK